MFDQNLLESKRFSVRRLVKEYSTNKIKRQTSDDFRRKLHASSSIERTAGSRRPLSSRTVDAIATIEDTAKVKLQILMLLRRVFLFPLVRKV